MGVSRADNSIKIWRNLPISNPKPDLNSINTHTKFGKTIYWCLLKLSSGNKNMGVSLADNSVKIWRNLPISNPKAELHNINAYIVWWKSINVFSSYRPETKIWAYLEQIPLWKFDESCPLAIPNQNFTVSVHIQNLVNIYLCLLKLSSWNENMS